MTCWRSCPAWARSAAPRRRWEALRVDAELLPLHGELPPAEQDRVLQPRPPAERRRHVVLATSIAETSLTVPGVRIVVDGGWRRVPRLDPGSGLTRLETVRVSRAAAVQRTGRAGRGSAGLRVSLLDRGHRARPRAAGPAGDPGRRAVRVPAAGGRLDRLHGHGRGRPAPAPTRRRPAHSRPPAACSAPWGGLDEAGAITPAGTRMTALGAHPRLAAMMLAATGPAEQALAADLAALLEERDPLRPRPAGGSRVGRSARRPPAPAGTAGGARCRRRRSRRAATHPPGGVRLSRPAAHPGRPPTATSPPWSRPAFPTGWRKAAATSARSAWPAAVAPGCRATTGWPAAGCWRWRRCTCATAPASPWPCRWTRTGCPTACSPAPPSRSRTPSTRPAARC